MATRDDGGALVCARDRAVLLFRRAGAAARLIGLSVGFGGLYLIFERLSFVGGAHGANITLWNPSAGLTVALLIVKGVCYVPLAMTAELLSSITLPVTPVSAIPVLLGALSVAGYGGAAILLRHAGLQCGIRGSADVVRLLVVTILVSGLVASGLVAGYAAAGIVPWSGFAEAAFHDWIGDAVGIAVFALPILLFYQRVGRQGVLFIHKFRASQIFECAAQGAAIVVALALVFSTFLGESGLPHFYVLFLPLIWMATRHGLAGASAAVLAIQLGLIAGLQIHGHSAFTLRTFQLFMFALAASGLMLGAVVSERRRLALALSDSERRRTAILNTARDGVFLLDAGGIIQSINPAVERLFALPGDRLVDRDASELIEGAPDLLDRLKIAAAAASSADNDACWEFDARRADGTMIPIELSVGGFDIQGAEQYTIVVRDISARRSAEARYQKHEAELAHVARVTLAGEMAAGLAHELSQPLTAILGYARGCLSLLAAMEPDRALIRDAVAEVVLQAERAAEVIDRLRKFIRGGAHREVIAAIKPLIDAAVSFARREAMQQKVKIQVSIDPNLPPINADPIQIEQVLLNLLRNAMEAMQGAGTERRSIVIEARGNGRQEVEISVSDSGPGIPAEVKDTIFESFVTTKASGMGMGLSISHSIIESHGGILRMAGTAACGATFIFNLPSLDAAVRADDG